MFCSRVSTLIVCLTLIYLNACAGADDGRDQGTANDNLTFSSSCDAPPACRGDLVGTWRLVTRYETFSEATLTAACFTGIDSFRGSEKDTLEVHEVSAIGYRWQREHNQSFKGKYPSGCREQLTLSAADGSFVVHFERTSKTTTF